MPAWISGIPSKGLTWLLVNVVLSRPSHFWGEKVNTNHRTIRLQTDLFSWGLERRRGILTTQYPPLPVWVRPVFSPLTNVICSNQPIKLGRAATQKLLHYSQVTATHLYPHCPLIGQNVGPTEPSLAGAGSFVSVLTRQTCPDLAWVIGWKLVHWHYGYNIITSQATPPYNHPGSTGYSLF